MRGHRWCVTRPAALHLPTPPHLPSPLAADFENCKCRGLSCVSNCTTSIYVGHRGSDRKGATMQSAYQIEQLNSYSVTGWLSDVSCRASGDSRAWPACKEQLKAQLRRRVHGAGTCCCSSRRQPAVQRSGAELHPCKCCRAGSQDAPTSCASHAVDVPNVILTTTTPPHSPRSCTRRLTTCTTTLAISSGAPARRPSSLFPAPQVSGPQVQALELVPFPISAASASLHAVGGR